jgi:hypothetical protein
LVYAVPLLAERGIGTDPGSVKNKVLPLIIPSTLNIQPFLQFVVADAGDGIQ